jgi:hypothetical protein
VLHPLRDFVARALDLVAHIGLAATREREEERRHEGGEKETRRHAGELPGGDVADADGSASATDRLAAAA